MIISCPTCSTKFKIKPELIGGGKNLTCAKCKHKWFFTLAPQTPTAAEIEQAIEKIVQDQHHTAQDADRPPMDAINHLAAQAQQGIEAREGGRHSFLRAFALFAILVVSIVALGIGGRSAVVTNWPPAARIYDLVGMNVPVLGAGLEIGGLQWELVKTTYVDEQTGDTVINRPSEIEIKGTVVNHTDDVMMIPELQIKLLDRQNKAFHQIKTKAAGEKILPKETIPFAAKMPIVEKTDFRVFVTFLDPNQPSPQLASADENRDNTQNQPHNAETPHTASSAHGDSDHANPEHSDAKNNGAEHNGAEHGGADAHSAH